MEGIAMRSGFVWGDPKWYANYRAAVKLAGGRLCFRGDPEDCDFLLLPGGGDLEPQRYGQENTASYGLEPERDRVELELIDRFVALRRPIFGVCRGMQVINVFFGGTLIQDIQGHRAVDGSDRYHRVKSSASPLRDLCGESCIVNSAHHQAVDQIGTGLEAVQWTADGTIEALCHRSLPIWGVQWHPERLDTTIGNRVIWTAARL